MNHYSHVSRQHDISEVQVFYQTSVHKKEPKVKLGNVEIYIENVNKINQLKYHTHFSHMYHKYITDPSNNFFNAFESQLVGCAQHSDDVLLYKCCKNGEFYVAVEKQNFSFFRCSCD